MNDRAQTAAIEVPGQSPAGAIAPGDIARTRAYIDAATAANTRRAYRSDWEHFTRWCATHGVPTLPASPETVALYLAALAQVSKVSTVQRRLTAIAKAHRAAGYETPTKSEAVHLTMRGIRRTHGVAPNQKAPAVLADLRAMLAVLPNNLIGTRDRALLLLGFAGAFRRSELVALDVADLAFGERGLTVTVRRSKGDQEGEGAKKGIPFGRHALTCPVTAVRDWMDMSQVSEGATLPPHQSPRPGRGDPAGGQGGGFGGQAHGGGGRTRSDASTPAIRCAPGWRRPPRRAARRSGTSCARPATAPSRCSAATSATASSSATMPPPSPDCRPGGTEDTVSLPYHRAIRELLM